MTYFNQQQQQSFSGAPLIPSRHIEHVSRLNPPSEPPARQPTRSTIRLFGPISNGITDVAFIARLKAIGCVDELTVEIDSIGGHTKAATNIAEAIILHRAGLKVGINVGKCCSAANLPFAVCTHRMATPGAVFMFHDVRQDGDRTPELSVALSGGLAELISERLYDTSVETVREWMHSETWLTSTQAKRFGYVSEIASVAIERAACDISHLRQPIPPTDYPATRTFEKEVAQSRASQPAIVPGKVQCNEVLVPRKPFWLKPHTAKAAEPFRCKIRNSADPELAISGIIGDDENDVKTVGAFLRANKNRPVKMFVDSPGGDAFAGIAMFNQLVQHGDVTVIIQSMAGSAATVMAAGAKTVMISQSASYFIHRAALVAAGNVDLFREAIDWLNAVDEGIARCYRAKTGQSPAQINSWMTGDGKNDGTLFTAKEAVAAKFCDAIIPTGSKGEASTARINRLVDRRELLANVS